ncbi:MAG: sporulation protein YtxC [Bacillota bacterium]
MRRSRDHAFLAGISLENRKAYYFAEVARLASFSVASGRALDSIRRILGREIQAWAERGVKVTVSESLTGELLVFRCEIRKAEGLQGQDVLRDIKDAVASGLSHVVIDEYERVLVQRLIDENYAYLSSGDREALRRKVTLRLNGKQSGRRIGLAERNRRKSRVWAKLAEYLEKENELVLEGFITFRLKDYLEDLFDTVEKTAEDYLTEREYQEFLRLLRYFMARQKDAATEVNVVRRGDSYSVLDHNMEPVSGEVGTFLKNPPGGFALGVDDLIVSAVVTLAPQRMVWHGPHDNSPCYDLLKDLLEDRMAHCPGCPADGGKPEPAHV